MQAKRQEVLTAIEKVSAGLSGDSEGLEQSNCVLFNQDSLRTYNEEVACTVSNPIPEINGAVVQGSKLLAVLRKRKEEELSFEIEDNALVIKSPGKRSKIKLEEEVKLPSITLPSFEDGRWVEVPECFWEGVTAASGVTLKTGKQFIKQCVHITPDFIEASDGIQGLRFPLEVPCLKEPILMRAAELRAVCISQAKFSLGDCFMADENNWIHFWNVKTGVISSCRKMEVSFYPDLAPYLEAEGQPITLPDLHEAVSIAIEFTKDNPDDHIRIDLKKGKLRVKGQGVHGSHEDQRDVEYEGEPLSFGIKPSILADISAGDGQCSVTDRYIMYRTNKYSYVSCLSEA